MLDLLISSYPTQLFVEVDNHYEDYREHTSILLNLDQNQTSHKQFWTKAVLNIVSQVMVALEQYCNISIPLLGIVSLVYLA